MMMMLRMMNDDDNNNEDKEKDICGLTQLSLIISDKTTTYCLRKRNIANI